MQSGAHGLHLNSDTTRCAPNHCPLTTTTGHDRTCITFTPDLAKFGMEEGGLEEDTVALMRKRVYDLAGVLGKTVKVRG